MKRVALHKICIVLALAALLPLELALVSGNTLAYLTAEASLTNTFTFEESVPIGDTLRIDTVNYYYSMKTGSFSQIGDSGYSGNSSRWRHYGNERIYVNETNTEIKAAPNGFKLSHVTVNGDRIDAGSSFLQPDRNSTINVYFEPIEYTIAYDFNGYSEEDITFTDTPLQSTYTVFDMIKVPYDAETVSEGTYSQETGFLNPISEYRRHCTVITIFGMQINNPDGIGTINCELDVPGASVEGNTLLGWEDQSGALHRYDNAGTNTSWSTDLTNIPNNGVYAAFAARQTGDLVLKARWEYEVAPNNANMNNMMRSIEAPELVPNTNTENTDTVENTESTENAESTKEEIVTGGTEGKQDGKTTTE